MAFPFTIFPLGDSALTIDFGNTIDEAVNKKVQHLFQQLKSASTFIIDVVPAYSSVTVYYDVLGLKTIHNNPFEGAKDLVLPFLVEEQPVSLSTPRQIRIPVCYAKPYALDLEEIASQKGLLPEEVIHFHTSETYRVYMIGFLPGFAYMGTVDERIAAPRRSQPRTNIPAGAVGIAGIQTGIYPLTSPGGWNVIGQTPMAMFDAQREDPVLLQPGDEISFYSITEDEFANYQGRHF